MGKQSILASIMGAVLLGAIPAVTEATLVAHWTFDESSGTTAFDSAGNNDGTIFGATRVDGILGGALHFDGAGDYINCGNDASLDMTDELSISAWINRPDFSTYSVIVGKNNGNSVTAGYGLFSYKEGVEFTFYSGDWRRTTPRFPVTANQWHHVAGTFDGDILRLYVDGEQKASLAYSGDITAAAGYPVQIAYWRSQSTQYFNGLLDDIRIYDVALSAAEIRQLSVPEPTSVALLGLWTLAGLRRRCQKQSSYE